MRTILTAAALVLALAVPAMAQTATPATPATPAKPAVTAPTAKATPADEKAKADKAKGKTSQNTHFGKQVAQAPEKKAAPAATSTGTPPVVKADGAKTGGAKTDANKGDTRKVN